MAAGENAVDPSEVMERIIESTAWSMRKNGLYKGEYDYEVTSPDGMKIKAKGILRAESPQNTLGSNVDPEAIGRVMRGESTPEEEAMQVAKVNPKSKESRWPRGWMGGGGG